MYLMRIDRVFVSSVLFYFFIFFNIEYANCSNFSDFVKFFFKSILNWMLNLSMFFLIFYILGNLDDFLKIQKVQKVMK